MKSSILYLAAAALAVQCASAVQIAPNSYSFDQATGSGSFTYHDTSTPSKLTDGVFGGLLTSQVAANDWLGWANKPLVNIDFVFGSEWNFNEVKVHTLQSGDSNIPLPNIDLYAWNGASWDLLALISNPESGAPNGVRLLTLDGFGEDASLLRLSLSHSKDGPWTFVSEVQFFGERIASNVPDGGSTALLLGLSVLGFGMFKRQR